MREENKCKLFATTLICTTTCTLRCKNCLLSIPHQKKIHYPLSKLKSDIASYFELVEFVDEFTVMGGEAFLHPEFAEIIEELMCYKNCIGKMFFITNASYVPSNAVLSCLESLSCNFIVHIDDYGALSKSLLDLLSEFDKRNIIYDLRHYNENEQYCGGWVDVIGDYEQKRYSKNELLEVFRNCKNKSNCKFIWDGKLYGCGMHAGGAILDKVPLAESDYINLRDKISPDEMIIKLTQMGRKSPYTGCQYCNGWNVERSVRIKAAIQLPSPE